MSGCIKHAELPDFQPVTDFSGRILVMTTTKRFQLEVDWHADLRAGNMRLTHAASGRVIDVAWQDERMRIRDNQQGGRWRDLPVQALKDMGILLPPWQMARVFLGKLPDSMTSKDNRTWQGLWHGSLLKIRWGQTQQRVELMDMRQGWRAVVIFS